ncbi:signal peptidase I [Patescibacteria group bacterium]|nr:signal peptidase I [Patescibacteria group bacterium]
MKNTLLFFWEVAKIVILALLIVIPIRYFVFQPFIVKGLSMTPAFHDGDYLIIDEFSYHFREPERGEVIVFKYPQDPSQRFIKRIIGLPEEQVKMEGGRITIINKFGEEEILNESDYLSLSQVSLFDTKQMKLGENEYFILGDNRAHSFDSRRWGPLKREYIVGKVLLRAWPPKAMAYIPTPSY